MLPVINGSPINGAEVELHPRGIDLLRMTAAAVEHRADAVTFIALSLGTGAILNDLDVDAAPFEGIDMLRMPYYARIDYGQPAPNKVVHPPTFRVLQLPELRAIGTYSVETESFVALSMGTGAINAQTQVEVPTLGAVLSLGELGVGVSVPAASFIALQLGGVYVRDVVPVRGIDLLRTTPAAIKSPGGRGRSVPTLGVVLALGEDLRADGGATAQTFFPLALGRLSVGRNPLC